MKPKCHLSAIHRRLHIQRSSVAELSAPAAAERRSNSDPGSPAVGRIGTLYTGVGVSYRSLYERCWRSSAERRNRSGSRSSLSGPTLREKSARSSCRQRSVNNPGLCTVGRIRDPGPETPLCSHLTRWSYSQFLPVKNGGHAQKLPRMQVPPFLQQLRLCSAAAAAAKTRNTLTKGNTDQPRRVCRRQEMMGYDANATETMVIRAGEGGGASVCL